MAGGGVCTLAERVDSRAMLARFSGPGIEDMARSLTLNANYTRYLLQGFRIAASGLSPSDADRASLVLADSLGRETDASVRVLLMSALATVLARTDLGDAKERAGSKFPISLNYGIKP